MRISDWSSDVCSSDLSLGAAYVSHIKADVFEMKARKYPTSLAASLSSNNIPEGVYRTLVKETNTGLPQLHRYFELRRKLLKRPDMHHYEIDPPMVQARKSTGRNSRLQCAHRMP